LWSNTLPEPHGIVLNLDANGHLLTQCRFVTTDSSDFVQDALPLPNGDHLILSHFGGREVSGYRVAHLDSAFHVITNTAWRMPGALDLVPERMSFAMDGSLFITGSLHDHNDGGPEGSVFIAADSSGRPLSVQRIPMFNAQLAFLGPGRPVQRADAHWYVAHGGDPSAIILELGSDGTAISTNTLLGITGADGILRADRQGRIWSATSRSTPYMAVVSRFADLASTSCGTLTAPLVSNAVGLEPVNMPLTVLGPLNIQEQDIVWSATRLMDWEALCGSTGLVAEGPDDVTALFLWPDPASDHCRIKLAQQDAGSLSVCDPTGRVVLVQPYGAGVAELTIDVSAWPNGLYLVQDRRPDGCHTVRVMVAH
jgi:hypothetical protein